MNRGGAREGAGRKTLGEKERTTLSVRIDPMTKQTLEKERDKQNKAAKDGTKTSIGQLIDHAVAVVFNKKADK